MARIRTIKPEFPQSESMGRVSREARLTFIMLWTLADDAGRLRGNSRMLASLLFPYDDDAPGLIDGWLEELTSEDCVTRYLADGGAYVQINNWLDHQKIDRPSDSKIPAPDEPSRTASNPREPSSLDQGPKDQGSEDQGPHAAPEALALEAEFEKFWEVYPKQADRGHALKAFRSVRKRGIDLKTLIDGAQAYRDDHRREAQYTKNAQSWLTGECWKDEAAAAPPPKPDRTEANEAARLENYAEMIRLGRSPGLNFTNVHRAKLIQRGSVTMEQCQRAGCAA